MENLDQLGTLLSPLLSDPEAMSSLRQAAEQMGLGALLPQMSGGSAEKDSLPEPPPRPQRQEQQNTVESSADIIAAVTRIAPLLNAPAEDDTSRLLTALRPFLSQPRIKRLDEAERLLSLTRVLSIMKESKLI